MSVDDPVYQVVVATLERRALVAKALVVMVGADLSQMALRAAILHPHLLEPELLVEVARKEQ